MKPLRRGCDQPCRKLSGSSILHYELRNKTTFIAFVGCMACVVLTMSRATAQSNPQPAAPQPAAQPTTAQQPRLRILFPAYANPANDDGKTMWSRLVELSKNRPDGLEIDIIFNPASGPGTTRDPNYLTEAGVGPLADVQAFRVLGYVTSSYGKRSIDDIKKDIDIYATGFYAGYVSGIFFDETSSSLNTATYYRQLHDYALSAIKHHGGKPVATVSNPGIGEVQPPITESALRAYATAMERIVVFENDAKKYRDAAPAAVKPFLSPANVVHIVHSQPTWSPQLITAMQRRGAANIFITDHVMPNPYNRLPIYFDQICDAVSAVNRSP